MIGYDMVMVSKTENRVKYFDHILKDGNCNLFHRNLVKHKRMSLPRYVCTKQG